jgi:acyl-CoA thioester hydrolase
VAGSTSPDTERRENFKHFHALELRWNDLDPYRHVNNARFYAFYDTAIMHYLTVEGGFDLLDGPVVPFTVENLCRFHKSFRFPTVVEFGLRTARIGTSSVRYELGLFARGESSVTATGYFIDVFVERESEKPCPIPRQIREHLEKILAPAQ